MGEAVPGGPERSEFSPDPSAWDRYGKLVEQTIKTIDDAAGTYCSSDLIPSPYGPVVTTHEAGSSPESYGYRGVGDFCDLICQLRNGETTPSEQVARSIDAVERLDPGLHGVRALEADRAYDEAQKLDKIDPADRGPLCGAPYARKDLFDRKGFAAQCGSIIYEDNISQETATVLNRLDAAGGIDIGRTVMAELAMSPTGFNAHEPHPRNPWNTDFVTGGSSSGSAVAIAAGYVRMALGTDTGGSIRHPAAMCGLTGLKPTIERVSRAGVWPLSWSLDCVGPLAKSARDCALSLSIMSGADDRDPTVTMPPMPLPTLGKDLGGVRIAVAGGYYREQLVPEVAEALDRAIDRMRDLGATIIETAPSDMQTVNTLSHLTLAVEASAQLRRHFMANDQRIGRQVRDRLEPGMFYPSTLYAEALRMRKNIRDGWLRSTMADADAVFMPAISLGVPSIQETTEPDLAAVSQKIAAVTHTTRGINYLGLPGLVAPCGRDGNGLPIAFQLIGKPFAEATLITIADCYQQNTDWHAHCPKLVAAAGKLEITDGVQ